MMKTEKEKLLAVLGGFALDDFGVEALLDVLALRLKTQAEKIEDLNRRSQVDHAHMQQDR